MNSLFPRVASLLPLAKRVEADFLLIQQRNEKLTPRLFTREKSPLIDAAASRIACGGSPPREERLLLDDAAPRLTSRLSLALEP